MSLSIFTNSDLPRWVQVVTRHIAELGVVFRTSFLNTINNLTLGICSDARALAMTLYQGKWETFCTNRPHLSLYFSFANNLQCIFLISFPVKKSRWKVHFNAFSLLRLFFSMPLSAIIQFHWFFYRFELFPCICGKKMTLHYNIYLSVMWDINECSSVL